jgi:phosphoglycerate dehydrogenase-like enzyme
VNESISLLRGRHWSGWTPTQLLGAELSGKSLGIFGMGRIGQAIAQRAKAFGMKLRYLNRSRLAPELEQGAIYEPQFDGLLEQSDALMLAAPATSETNGILNQNAIARLKHGAIVVNIARGSLVVDNALIDALQNGRIRAAGLDVFDGEPAIDPRYFALPNVFMLPHIGSSTVEARLSMARKLIDQIGQSSVIR